MQHHQRQKNILTAIQNILCCYLSQFIHKFWTEFSTQSRQFTLNFLLANSETPTIYDSTNINSQLLWNILNDCRVCFSVFVYHRYRNTWSIYIQFRTHFSSKRKRLTNVRFLLITSVLINLKINDLCQKKTTNFEEPRNSAVYLKRILFSMFFCWTSNLTLEIEGNRSEIRIQ